MEDKFDELAQGLAQLVTRRQAFKKFGAGLAGMVLAAALAFSASAEVALGPLIEVSFPNPLAGCNDGFESPTWTNWTIQDAAETCVAVNPANPKNIAAMWIALFQNIITAESFDGGATWQLNPLPLTVCAGGPYLGATDPWISAPHGPLSVITRAWPAPAKASLPPSAPSIRTTSPVSSPGASGPEPESPHVVIRVIRPSSAVICYGGWMKSVVKNKQNER